MCDVDVFTRGFECDLALLPFGRLSDESVSEQVGGDGSFVRIGLEAAQDEGLGL